MQYIYALLILFAVLSCSTQKHFVNDNQNTNVKDSIIVNNDATVREETVIDTVSKQYHELIETSNLLNDYRNRYDSLRNAVTEQDSTIAQHLHAIDSLQLALIAKDNALIQMAYDLKHNKLTLEPIEQHTDYAWARAGITNSKLWLELFQKDIYSTSHTKDSIVNSETIIVKDSIATKDTIVTSETIKSKPFFAQVWFWIALCSIVLLILTIVIAIKMKTKIL